MDERTGTVLDWALLTSDGGQLILFRSLG
jgi:hypothetical protein